jgi:hypothetical protein
MGWKRARDLERMRDLMREEETGRAPLLSSARRGGSDLHLVVSHSRTRTHALARLIWFLSGFQQADRRDHLRNFSGGIYSALARRFAVPSCSYGVWVKLRRMT